MRRFSTKFLVPLVLLLFLLNAAAQTKQQRTQDRPNLAGTWIVDKSKEGSAKNHVWVISHSGDEIKIVETFDFGKTKISNKLVLFTDDRGERNLVSVPGGDAPNEVNSRTKWKKNKLIRSYTFTRRSKRIQEVSQCLSMLLRRSVCRKPATG